MKKKSAKTKSPKVDVSIAVGDQFQTPQGPTTIVGTDKRHVEGKWTDGSRWSDMRFIVENNIRGGTWIRIALSEAAIVGRTAAATMPPMPPTDKGATFPDALPKLSEHPVMKPGYSIFPVQDAKHPDASSGTAGRKFDSEKLRYDLVDPFAIAWLVSSLTYGAVKYEPENWRKVPGWKERYYASTLRHLEAWRSGEDDDPESGLPHLAGVMFGAMCLTALAAPRSLTEVATRTSAAIARWRATPRGASSGAGTPSEGK